MVSRTLFLLVAATLAMFAGVARGADITYVVNSQTDAVDASFGDGVCATADGTCTLRAALMEALPHPLDHITVRLPAGIYKRTRPPAIASPSGPSADGDMYVEGNVTIQGAGARQTIIDLNKMGRAFFIDTIGQLTISDVTIENGLQSATTEPQPGAIGGGAIGAQGKLYAYRVVLRNNQSGTGGAVMSDKLGREPGFPDSYVELHDSLVVGNVATDEGGAFRFDGPAKVINSTIADNTVLSTCCSSTTGDGTPEGEGGGIDARGEGELDIVNSTIVGNHAVVGGGGINIADGYTGAVVQGVLYGPLDLRNTIVANNTSDRGPANCKRTGATFTSLGHNLAGDGTCFLTAAGDKPKTDPLLGPLGDHGGPTDTFALLAGSPAIAAATDCPAADQRGVARAAVCDIGAVAFDGCTGCPTTSVPGFCRSRRHVTFRLPRGARRVRLYVDGRRRRAVVHGRSLSLALYGLPRRAVRVRIAAIADGRAYSRTTTLHPCTSTP